MRCLLCMLGLLPCRAAGSGPDVHLRLRVVQPVHLDLPARQRRWVIIALRWSCWCCQRRYPCVLLAWQRPVKFSACVPCPHPAALPLPPAHPARPAACSVPHPAGPRLLGPPVGGACRLLVEPRGARPPGVCGGAVGGGGAVQVGGAGWGRVLAGWLAGWLGGLVCCSAAACATTDSAWMLPHLPARMSNSPHIPRPSPGRPACPPSRPAQAARPD